MKESTYIENTTVAGIPDFVGKCEDGMRGQTMHFGGSGKIRDCMKCGECGYSITLVTEKGERNE